MGCCQDVFSFRVFVLHFDHHFSSLIYLGLELVQFLFEVCRQLTWVVWSICLSLNRSLFDTADGSDHLVD